MKKFYSVYKKYMLVNLIIFIGIYTIFGMIELTPDCRYWKLFVDKSIEGIVERILFVLIIFYVYTRYD